MRRLPVFLLLDTSGSMKGEPLESVRVGIETMLAALRSDPFALESVHICLITFDREAQCLAPLTPLEEFRLPEIVAPESGPTHTGAALKLLTEIMDRDLVRTSAGKKGDWKPLLFLMTDGKPSDTALYQQMCETIKKRGFAGIISCAAGMKAKIEPLKLLSDNVYALQTMTQADFVKFFQWVSSSICVGSQSMGIRENLNLPPPPEEVVVYC